MKTTATSATTRAVPVIAEFANRAGYARGDLKTALALPDYLPPLLVALRAASAHVYTEAQRRLERLLDDLQDERVSVTEWCQMARQQAKDFEGRAGDCVDLLADPLLVDPSQAVAVLAEALVCRQAADLLQRLASVYGRPTSERETPSA